MAQLKIAEISLAAGVEDVVRGFWLNSPQEGSSNPSYALTLIGYAVGAESPVRRIDVSDRRETIWRLPINMDRGELVSLYNDIRWAGSSGFYHIVSSLKLPRSFELDLEAVLDDSSCVRVGTIKGSRSALPDSPSRFQPVVVMSLGRTGSTWAAALLGQHPDVLAFRPMDHEPRLLRYWTDVFSVLSEPASYRESLAADLSPQHWWTGTDRRSPPAPQLDTELEQWLGDQYVADLARLAKERIDAFYQEVAKQEGKEGARYFVEKALPAGHHERIWPDLYPEAREVFLVRDFRDVVCSMLSYNRARGFGREDVKSDEEFIRGTFAEGVRRLVECWHARRAGAHLLRYEDVILQPEESLRSLFSFLDLEANDRLIAATLEQAQALSPTLQQNHKTSNTFARSIGRWRRDLTAAKRAACEESFGDALELFGYGDSDQPEAQDGPVKLAGVEASK